MVWYGMVWQDSVPLANLGPHYSSAALLPFQALTREDAVGSLPSLGSSMYKFRSAMGSWSGPLVRIAQQLSGVAPAAVPSTHAGGRRRKSSESWIFNV